MQVHLRSANSRDFPDLDRCTNLKTQGRLASPEEAAARVLAYLARTDFGSQPVADVNEG
jgi:hypothetical protein